MNVGRCTLLFLAAGFFAGLGPASFGEEQPPNWDALFAQLTALDWGQSLAPLQPIERAVQQAQVSGEPSQATMLEERLLNALRDADHRAAKDYICRQLARIGTAAAVPELSQLLDDEQLAHPARVALEAIPDETAVTALRLALERVDGRRQTGIMQSLGTLRDADAVPRLVELLRDADPEVAAAAAMALGRIGTHEAAQSLDTWDETSSVPRATRIDARRIAAEQQLPRGETGEVAKLARRWSSVEPTHVRVMAFRLLLEAEPAEAEAQLEGRWPGRIVGCGRPRRIGSAIMQPPARWNLSLGNWPTYRPPGRLDCCPRWPPTNGRRMRCAELPSRRYGTPNHRFVGRRSSVCQSWAQRRTCACWPT